RNRFTVNSPKTEHIEGHESREVPIFAELRPYLEAAKAEAAKDEEYVITIPSVAVFRAGGPSPNLGTRMQKIIRRAGVSVWPKLFQNLRATRQTELVARGEQEHAVCQWLGNSQAVAREHYLRVTDADFERVASSEGTERDAQRDALKAENGMRQGSMPAIAWDALLLQIVQKA